MSNAILHSCQYQNYRRIDLIVIHCSATRATQCYTVDARSTPRGRMPKATTVTASASATKVA